MCSKKCFCRGRWLTEAFGFSRPVKREVDEIGAASNAWKKTMPVKLSLYDEVGSFLREDGLVKLD